MIYRLRAKLALQTSTTSLHFTNTATSTVLLLFRVLWVLWTLQLVISPGQACLRPQHEGVQAQTKFRPGNGYGGHFEVLCSERKAVQIRQILLIDIFTRMLCATSSSSNNLTCQRTRQERILQSNRGQRRSRKSYADCWSCQRSEYSSEVTQPQTQQS